MNPHNDLLNKGCAAPTKWYVLVAGAVVVIALCVIGAIAGVAVS